MIHQWSNRIWKFFLCIAIMVLSACESGEMPDPPDPSLPFPEETVYLSMAINIGNQVRTKGPMTENVGTFEERYVKKVRMVLYDGDETHSKVVKAFNFQIETNGGSGDRWIDRTGGEDLAPTTDQSDGTHFITYARKVPDMDLKMLVIINPTTLLEELTQDAEEGGGISKTLGEFLTERKIEGDGQKTSDLGGLAKDKYFLMTNSQGLVDVSATSLWDTKNQAHNSPVSVMVDRVVSKVTVTLPDNQTEIPVKENAEAQDFSWSLDVTNKWTYWMRNNTESPGTLRKDWYAIDPNFTGTSSLTDSERADNFFYYSNQSDDTPSGFLYGFNDSEYCLENTMDENEQSAANVITRVLMRCVYKPANVNNIGDSFYTHQGKTYSEEDMAEFTRIAEEYPEIVLDDLCLLIKKANSDGFTFNGEPRLHGGLVEYSFEYDELQYFYRGVNYYAIKVLHFGDTDSTNPLQGHYGIVRNTHYKVKIEGIDGPGSSTITSGGIITRGSSPSTGTLYNNISAKIEVLR